MPMAWEIRVQSQAESYQRHKKWYFKPPCLTLSIIRYGSRVKWSNPEKSVAPSSTPWCSCYWKKSLQVPLNYGCLLIVIVFTQFDGLNLYYLILIILFNINHLFADSEVVTSIAINTSYSNQYHSFVCTQWNGSKYCYVPLTIQLNMSFIYSQLNDQTFLFLAIQFNVSHCLHIV